jgi:hypothetical protein
VANDTENFKKRHFWVIDKIKKSVLLVFELNDEGHQKIYSNSPVEIQEITISDINSINILK